MSKLIFILFSISITAGANSTNTIDSFWKKCAKDKKGFYQQLHNYDQLVQSQFENKSTSELVKIYSQDSKESRYLGLYAAFLLPAGVMAEFDKSCWAILQDGIQLSKGGDFTQADEKLLAWRSCIDTHYKRILPEVAAVLRCKK